MRLREIGLMKPDGRRGGRVVQASRPTVAEMYEVREALEAHATRLAAEQAAPEAKARIARAAARSLTGAEADDRNAFQIADLSFHRAIAASTRNDRSTLVEFFFDLIAAVRQRDFRDVEASRRCAEAHVAIADAISGPTGSRQPSTCASAAPRVRDGSDAHSGF